MAWESREVFSVLRCLRNNAFLLFSLLWLSLSLVRRSVAYSYSAVAHSNVFVDRDVFGYCIIKNRVHKYVSSSLAASIQHLEFNTHTHTFHVAIFSKCSNSRKIWLMAILVRTSNHMMNNPGRWATPFSTHLNIPWNQHEPKCGDSTTPRRQVGFLWENRIACVLKSR